MYQHVTFLKMKGEVSEGKRLGFGKRKVSYADAVARALVERRWSGMSLCLMSGENEGCDERCVGGCSTL